MFSARVSIVTFKNNRLLFCMFYFVSFLLRFFGANCLTSVQNTDVHSRQLWLIACEHWRYI